MIVHLTVRHFLPDQDLEAGGRMGTNRSINEGEASFHHLIHPSQQQESMPSDGHRCTTLAEGSMLTESP